MNFKKNVVPPVKSPSFPGYENNYTVQSQKKSVSLLTLVIVVVVILSLAVLLFKNYDRITNFFMSSVESTEFQIGQEVMLSGDIQSDGDLIIYTHTLNMDNGTVVWLKSRTLDLSIYSGFIEVQGVVERNYTDIFIVEVSAVSWALANTWSTWDLLWSWSGIYFPQVGIYLPAEFGQKYTLLNQWEGGVLKVQNLSNNQIIQIVYFACKTSDPNKNCSQLKENIWSSAEKTVSSSRGDKLYKLEGITSWYFSNGNYYGYFINDMPEQEVIDVVNAFVLPTETYVKNTLLSNIQTLCEDGTTSLMNVENYSLGIDLNGLYATLQWPTADGSASCKIFIDPSKAVWWAKVSYITNTPSASAVDTGSVVDTSSAVVSNLDTSVKQFPINLEKSMTFSSTSKWYSIIFPSSNIAYEASNIGDDLWLPGVRCSTQMNVTKFADKLTLNEDPKVKIFTCTIKGTLNNLGNDMIQKEAANWTKFIIQIMDSAWIDFATNIQIN